MSAPPAQVISVLLIESDKESRADLERRLVGFGCEVRAAAGVVDGRALLAREAVDLVIVAWQLPDGTGVEVVKGALAERRAQHAYCLFGRQAEKNLGQVVQAMRAGCTGVLEQPFDEEQIAEMLRPWQARAADLAVWRRRFAPGIAGDDPALLEALRVTRSVARTEATVLITGESGTGKELAARAIHDASPRCDGPFVALNCAAIPESLVEAELFGHARGAFTGAVAARTGRIAAANGGTLFLDEVGDLPLSAQAKLLRVLQDRCVTPVGTDTSVPVNVRIIAATHRDLEGMAETEGTFRIDLYFRLAVIPLHLPPLRERVGDIVPLARFFLQRDNATAGTEVLGFDDSCVAALEGHHWPGNVRELANTIERAVVMKREGMLSRADLHLFGRRSRQLTPVAMPARLATPQARATTAPPPPAAPGPQEREESLNLRVAMDDIERKLIERALERTGGNRTEAAALLGLNRTTLSEKLSKLRSSG